MHKMTIQLFVLE